MNLSRLPIFRQREISAPCQVRARPSRSTKQMFTGNPARRGGVKPHPSPFEWVRDRGQRNASECMDKIHPFRRRSGLLLLMARATKGAGFSFVFPNYARSESKFWVVVISKIDGSIRTRKYRSGRRPWLHQLLNELAGSVRGYPHATIDQRALVQHGFGTVQGRNVGALEEFSDRDLITPQQ